MASLPFILCCAVDSSAASGRLELVARCGGRTALSCWSLRRGSGYAGRYVVGIDSGLGDVGFTLPPEDGGKLLLCIPDVQEEGEAVILGILDRGAAELLSDLAEGFLDVGVVGVLSIFDIALEGLCLVVDGFEAGSALFIGDGGGESLVLLLEGLELRGLRVDGVLLRLVLLLNFESRALGFIGSDDTLFEGDDGDLCGDGFRLDFSLRCGGCGVGRCRGFGGLSQEGGGCEASCQRSSKDKGTVHAVCETPYRDPDSGGISWVTRWVIPGANRRRERLPHLTPPVETLGEYCPLSLSHRENKKERVAGAVGQSAERNYIGQLRGGVN